MEHRKLNWQDLNINSFRQSFDIDVDDFIDMF